MAPRRPRQSYSRTRPANFDERRNLNEAARRSVNEAARAQARQPQTSDALVAQLRDRYATEQGRPAINDALLLNEVRGQMTDALGKTSDPARAAELQRRIGVVNGLLQSESVRQQRTTEGLWGAARGAHRSGTRDDMDAAAIRLQELRNAYSQASDPGVRNELIQQGQLLGQELNRQYGEIGITPRLMAQDPATIQRVISRQATANQRSRVDDEPGVAFGGNLIDARNNPQLFGDGMLFPTTEYGSGIGQGAVNYARNLADEGYLDSRKGSNALVNARSNLQVAEAAYRQNPNESGARFLESARQNYDRTLNETAAGVLWWNRFSGATPDAGLSPDQRAGGRSIGRGLGTTELRMVRDVPDATDPVVQARVETYRGLERQAGREPSSLIDIPDAVFDPNATMPPIGTMDATNAMMPLTDVAPFNPDVAAANRASMALQRRPLAHHPIADVYGSGALDQETYPRYLPAGSNERPWRPMVDPDMDDTVRVYNPGAGEVRAWTDPSLLMARQAGITDSRPVLAAQDIDEVMRDVYQEVEHGVRHQGTIQDLPPSYRGGNRRNQEYGFGDMGGSQYSLEELTGISRQEFNALPPQGRRLVMQAAQKKAVEVGNIKETQALARADIGNRDLNQQVVIGRDPQGGQLVIQMGDQVQVSSQADQMGQWDINRPELNPAYASGTPWHEGQYRAGYMDRWDTSDPNALASRAFIDSAAAQGATQMPVRYNPVAAAMEPLAPAIDPAWTIAQQPGGMDVQAGYLPSRLFDTGGLISTGTPSAPSMRVIPIPTPDGGIQIVPNPGLAINPQQVLAQRLDTQRRLGIAPEGSFVALGSQDLSTPATLAANAPLAIQDVPAMRIDNRVFSGPSRHGQNSYRWNSAPGQLDPRHTVSNPNYWWQGGMMIADEGMRTGNPNALPGQMLRIVDPATGLPSAELSAAARELQLRRGSYGDNTSGLTWDTTGGAALRDLRDQYNAVGAQPLLPGVPLERQIASRNAARQDIRNRERQLSSMLLEGEQPMTAAIGQREMAAADDLDRMIVLERQLRGQGAPASLSGYQRVAQRTNTNPDIALTETIAGRMAASRGGLDPVDAPLTGITSAMGPRLIQARAELDNLNGQRRAIGKAPIMADRNNPDAIWESIRTVQEQEASDTALMNSPAAQALRERAARRQSMLDRGLSY